MYTVLCTHMTLLDTMTLLGLLDLSAAFDRVDHDILLHGLEVAFGVTNTALEWIRSFLTDRTQLGLVLRSPVADTASTVRRAARVGAGSTAVRALHRRAGTDRRAPRPTSTHVRRRLPGVPQHVRRRCSSGS